MKISKSKKEIIDLAVIAGYEVFISDTWFSLKKYRTDRWGNKTIKSGLKVYQSGWSFDLTVDLSVAKGIKSEKEIRSVLSI